MELIQAIEQFAWIGWLVLILVFLVIEMLTLDFTFLMLSIGGIAGLGSDLLGAPIWLQVIIAAARGRRADPRAPAAAAQATQARRGPHAHERRRAGRPAPVRCCPTVSAHGGQVKLSNGDTWTARPDTAAQLEPGTVDPGEPHRRRHGVRPTRGRGTAHMTPESFIPTAIGWVLAAAVFIFVLVVIVRSIRIIPQATAGVVERLGRYHKTLMPGLNILVPFIDRVRPLIDMREQVVSFPPQPVITEDNLVVSIDTVIYFQVTDPRAATYEIRNYLGAVEQLTTTTLRNVVGGLNLEEALTSRDEINGQLRIVLDEATGKWGIRVGRVELKAIDPPVSIQDSMEKQMRAERDRRALILTAEGTKQSAILTAEGARQAEILRAEGDKAAAVLRAQGEAEAIQTVFNAIHLGQSRRQAPRVPVPADAAQDRRQRLEQALDHPERVHRGPQGHEHGVRRLDDRHRAASRPGRGARAPAGVVTHGWFEGVARPASSPIEAC